MNTRNIASIEVTPELVGSIIRERHDELPDDATLVELWNPSAKSRRRTMRRIFESDEFDSIAEGATVPLIDSGGQ